jgi:hypothetical protein
MGLRDASERVMNLEPKPLKICKSSECFNRGHDKTKEYCKGLGESGKL